MHAATFIPLLAALAAAQSSTTQTAINVGPVVILDGTTISAPGGAATSVNLSPSANGQNSTGTTIISNGSDSSSQCPGDQLNANINGQQFCCPGAIYDDENGIDNAYCCVGADYEVGDPECFPFCSTSAPASVTQQSCLTTIPLTATDYSSLAAAAAGTTAPASGSGSNATITGGSSGTTVTGASGSSAVTSGTSVEGQDGEAGQDGADASSSESASDSGNAAAAMITRAPLAGAIMAAGGLLLAL